MNAQARVGVVACGALALHVRAIAARRGWPVDVHPLPPALHNRPERIHDVLAFDEVREALAEQPGTLGTPVSSASWKNSSSAPLRSAAAPPERRSQ